MLVLTRKLNEEVVIGDTIRVTLLEIRGSKVRLGFTVPPEVTVHRDEIYRQIKHTGDGVPSTLRWLEGNL